LLDNTVVARVADDGAGLPPPVAEALLRESSVELTGVGFGLKIVKGIVESHGGSLLVEQVPTGTSLLVTLPTKPSPTDEVPETSLDEW